MFLLFRSKAIGVRIKRVNTLYRQITTNGKGFILCVVSLVIIKIAVRHRAHNSIVPCFSSLNTTADTSPRHHSSIRCESTFQNLVPAYNFAPFGCQYLFSKTNNVALQVLFSRMFSISLYSQFFYFSLALRALLPAYFRTLIAPYMNIF